MALFKKFAIKVKANNLGPLAAVVALAVVDLLVLRGDVLVAFLLDGGLQGLELECCYYVCFGLRKYKKCQK